jgi:hypothetical protein
MTTVKSRMPTTEQVVTQGDLAKVEAVATPATYDYLMVGAHTENSGGGGVYMAIIHDNDVSVDYIIEEGLTESGPFKTRASGTVTAAAGITYDKSDVLYGAVVRLGVKATSTLGVYSAQIYTH